MIRGGHGTGKTVFALHFLYANACKGCPGLFVSFEESVEAIRRNAAAMGWDLESLEKENKLALLSFDVGSEMILTGEFDISSTIAMIESKAKSIGAELCAIDAFDWLLSLYSSENDRRTHLLRLHRSWGRRPYTTIFTVKDAREEAGTLDYLCDCVVELDNRTDAQISVRRLRVTKYRGSGFLNNEHPYVVGEDGPQMLPVSGVTLTHKPIIERISSGDAHLDELLGGGYFQGGCSLIAGSSGTGKTTLLCTFAHAACQRGERVLFVSFEESSDSLIFTMGSPGIDLQQHVDAGHLTIHSSFPEAKGTDQHLIQIMNLIESIRPDHICVDAISTAQRMGTGHSAFDFQIRLFYACKGLGVSCITSIQSKELDTAREMGHLELSSVAETVVALEQTHNADSSPRKVTIVKSRGTAHYTGANPFTISSEGMNFKGNAIPPHAADSDTPQTKRMAD